MKNRLIRLLWKFFSHKKKIAEPKNILVVTTTGIGDTLWASPALQVIANKYPTANVSMLTTPIGKQLLQGHPPVKEFFTIKDKTFFPIIPLFFRLKKRHFDTIYIFHVSQRPVFTLIGCLGATRIIGTKGLCKGLDNLLTLSTDKCKEHEIVRRLRIVGDITATHPMRMVMESKSHFSFPYIVFQIGAKDAFKLWPKEYFIELGKKLVKNLNVTILITGSPLEKEETEKLAKQIPKTQSIAGRYSLQEIAQIIGDSKLVITNDTGPMHIAFALEVKTLALFGPTDVSLCGPWNTKNAHTITTRKTCFPCAGKKCYDSICMRQISVNEVYTKAKDLYENSDYHC